MSPLVIRVALLLAGSGFCALVYQNAWFRMMRLVFGASTAASAAVLAIFMGGLGIGGYLLGRRADAHKNPLMLYAHLELGVAAAALASPALIAAVRWVYFTTGGSMTLGHVGSTVVRLLLAALVLGIPAVLMGGTLPAAVRAVEAQEDAGRRDIGVLYAINTMGAVLGTMWSTFSALEALGTQQTLWFAAVLNALVAVIARGMARALPPEKAGGGARAEAAIAAAGADTARRAAPRAYVLIAAGLAGFGFFLLELVWYRMLGPILGGSSYTFGLILGCALLGIGLGGWLYGRGRERQRPTLAGFVWTCTLEALAVLVPFAMGDTIAVWAMFLRPLGDLGFTHLVAAWAAIALAVVFPAAVVAGYQFPLLIGLLGEGKENAGRDVGHAYAWNTAGAIVGSLAGGFGLMPLMTAPRLWVLVAVIFAVLAFAGAMLHVYLGRGPRAIAVPVGLGLFCLWLTGAEGPTAAWRHVPIGAGRAKPEARSAAELQKWQNERRWRILWEADGAESSVALGQSTGLAFLVNGKSDGHAINDASTAVMSGLVGAMIHPSPKSAMVIGLGTGSTAGWLGKVRTMERVDVVELEPAIIEVARRCAAVNQGVLDNKIVHLHLGDGREALLASGRTYDIVFSEPSNPYRAGIASLFTLEFYEAVRDRLTDDGIFVQWTQGYEISAETVQTIMATLDAAFPVVETWQSIPGRDILFLAGKKPFAHDFARIDQLARYEPFRTALGRVWGVQGGAGLYAGFIAGPGLVKHIAERAGGRVNTDDRTHIEFDFARSVGQRRTWNFDQLRVIAESLGEHRPRFQGAGPEWGQVMDMRGQWSVLRRLPVPEPPPDMPAELGKRMQARRAYSEGRPQEARTFWHSQPVDALGPMDAIMLAELHAITASAQALPRAAQLRGFAPVEAGIAEAWHHYTVGDWAASARTLTDAFKLYRADPWAPDFYIQRALGLARTLATKDANLAPVILEGLAQPFAVYAMEETRVRVRIEIVSRAGLVARCVEAFGALEPHVPWEPDFLRARRDCYKAANAPPRLLERAEHDLAVRDSQTPARIGEETGRLPQFQR